MTEDQRMRVVAVQRETRPFEYKIVCCCGSEIVQGRRTAGLCYTMERGVYHVDLRCSDCGHEELARKLGMRSRYTNLGAWERRYDG